MNKEVEIYFSPEHKVTYSEIGDMFTIYKWNAEAQNWDFLDDKPVCHFAEDWIKDLILNGKAEVRGVYHEQV